MKIEGVAYFYVRHTPMDTRKQTYKKRKLAVVAEWEELQALTQQRRNYRFRKAFQELQRKGQGAIVCAAEIADHWVEGQWLLVEIETWKQAPWFSRWPPNLELDSGEHKYVYIKINSSYTGKYSLKHLQLNKPNLGIHGLWYFTQTDFDILAPLLLYPEHNYSWLHEQVSLDADGNPHGHHYQCHRYGVRSLADMPWKIATYHHGQITWGDSKVIDAYFGKLMFLTMEQSSAYYAYHKRTYGNDPKKPYSFDKDGIPYPSNYSGLFDTDIPSNKKYLEITGLTKKSLEDRRLLIQLRADYLHALMAAN